MQSRFIVMSQLIIFLLAGTSMHIPKANADAYYANCESPNLPYSLPIFIVVADSNLEIGDVIPGGDRYWNMNITCDQYADVDDGCGDGGNWTIGGIDFDPVGTVPRTYKIAGLPNGIGMQFLDASGNLLPLGTGQVRLDLGVKPPSAPHVAHNVPLRIRIVKTAETISEGNTNASFQISCVNREWANRTAPNSTISFSSSVLVTTNTCNLSTSNTVVNLPPVGKKEFTGIGSTLGLTNFNLNFVCDAGVHAFAYLSDASNQGNNTDILSLESSSTATGVGLQINQNTRAIRYAPDKMIDGTIDVDTGTDTFSLNNYENDMPRAFNFGLSANYIQTAEEVTTGSVSGIAEVLIVYR